MGIINLNKLVVVLALSLSLTLFLFPNPTSAQLSTTFYKNSCPNVEAIVKKAVNDKVSQTFVTIPATLRLFFHDCFVTGCDASTTISLPGGNAEKDSDDNKSLAGDGFDTVIKAKQAVEAKCPGKVSCADILALAARDVVVAAGGKWFPVEMGRFDGKSSSASSVNGNLPKPTMNTDQLTALFKAKGLSQQDMIALSGAHTLGFSHCSHVIKRYDTDSKTVNPSYLSQLKQMCPRNVDERIAINMDPTTPRIFDNVYYKNLQQRKGLFTSDQDLWENPKTKGIVDNWAKDANAFNTAFALAMKNLGRVGVKTSKTGNIRRRCDAFN